MRWWRVALVAVLLASGFGVAQRRTPGAGAVGAWTTLAAAPRDAWGGKPTVLPDGRVLVTNFVAVTQDTAAHGYATLYDPALGSWTATAPLDPQGGIGAPTLLPDGRVLLSGGSINGGISPGGRITLNTAQLYDPAADRWLALPRMATSRSGHTATVLRDGTVLVVGGMGGYGSGPSPATASAERFDPRTGRWTTVAPLPTPRGYHLAASLPDGRVLVVGGLTTDQLGAGRSMQDAIIYDPNGDRWSAATAPLATHGLYATATALPDGRVLVAGGTGREISGGTAVVPAERYDPAADRWVATAPPRQLGYGHAATVLPDGSVLLIGAESLTPAQRYDPAADRWVGVARTAAPHFANAAATLPDGRVLLTGDVNGGPELYTPDPGPSACFAETGFCVRGRFLAYWQAHGGLALNGYPLGAEHVETLEDGQNYTVQYFERVRMEYHPEQYPPSDVLLGQFGRRILGAAYAGSPRGHQIATAPAAPLADARFFPETGHNLSGRFLAYWEAHGGLAQFGYPLTELREDGLYPGTTLPNVQTQYFERARFEYHPENDGTPYEVLLGQFGRQLAAENTLLSGQLARLYLTDSTLPVLLGPPQGAAWTGPGAVQFFQGGLMIYRGDTRRIYVLHGSVQSGEALIPNPIGSELAWADEWVEGDEPGGGAAPIPGLFLPARGFGKLWREGAGVRSALGYANTAEERGYTLTVQSFRTGLLLTVDGPNGPGIYALTIEGRGNSNAPAITYRRYLAP